MITQGSEPRESESKGDVYKNYHDRIAETKRDVDQLVTEIQTKWPGALIFKTENPEKHKRLALWSVSDFLLITTLRDGQSILPLEFIAVKKGEKKLGHSAVIMSQYAGCCRSLTGILKINPFSLEECMRSLDTVINMKESEREQRLQISFSYIENQSTKKWAETFLRDLKR